MTAGETLGTWVAESLGLDGKLLGTGRIEHALATVMGRSSLLDAETCVARVLAGGAERQALIDELVIPETWFFRDREPFVLLAQHARDLWGERSSKREVRVLSLACATGEEAYSIAITLAEAGLPAARFRIDAVDISARSLAKARRAVYGRNSFREDTALGARYFTPQGEGCALDARIARRVSFKRGNVVGEIPPLGPGKYDVVFCRNLLIYLSEPAREKVVALCRRWLLPDGLLFVGHSEVPFFRRHGFTPVKHARAFACRLEDALPAEPRREARPTTRATPGRPARSRQAAVATAAPATRVGGGRQTETSAVERIRCLADAGAAEEAGRLCEQYLREHCTDVDALYLMGLIHQTADRRSAAEESFRRTLYLAPDHYEALVHLSLLCQERGDPAKAEILRQRARRVFEATRGIPRSEPA